MNIERLCTHCMTESDTPAGGRCPVCGRPMHTEPQLTHQLKPLTILQGKYLVGDVLGEGGFGITYIGMDMQLEMKVAIKEFYPNGYASRESMNTSALTIYSGQSEKVVLKWRENFLREARTLARVNNLSGVVGVREFFQENNTAYIIMDYVEGQTLKDYAKANGGRIQASFLLPAIEPVITSLQKVHEQGLIHRDISPDNIMLGPDGSMKLLDFGAARDFQGGGERSLSVMLKPGYAPAEQYSSGGDQGPWTDVYAMAGTIYKCLTGVTPPEAMDRLRTDELVPPNRAGAGLNPAQEQALLRALAVYKENRSQSMDELHQGLYGAGIPGARTIQPPVNPVNPVNAGGQEKTIGMNEGTVPGPDPRQTAWGTGGSQGMTQPAGQYVDPVTGQTVNPYVDPVTGQPVNPYVDPVTGQPITPPPPPKRGMSVGAKVGIGLGIACAVLAVGGLSMFFFLRGRLQSALGGSSAQSSASAYASEDNLEIETEDSAGQSSGFAPSGGTGGYSFNDPDFYEEDEELEEEDSDVGTYPYTPEGALQAFSDYYEYEKQEYEVDLRIAMVRIDSDSVPEAVIRGKDSWVELVYLTPSGELMSIDSYGKNNVFCYDPGRGKFMMNSYDMLEEGGISRDSYSFGTVNGGSAWVDDLYFAEREEYEGANPHMGCFLNEQRMGQFQWISDMQSKYYIRERVEDYVLLSGFTDSAQAAYDAADSHLSDGDAKDPMHYTHYFLPYAKNCYLTWDDLEGLDQQQERLARNELYARHGMHFQSEDLRNHFNSEVCSVWYEDEGLDANQAMSRFNEVERANMDLITLFRDARGY